MDNYYNNPQQTRPSAPGQPGNIANQKAVGDVLNLSLTPDEQRVLKDCQTQATIRGVTFGVVALGGCHYLMKTGKLQKNKLILAFTGFTGFLFGTMSYRTTCMQKLLALPNSTLKERILQAQGRQPELRVELQPQDGQSQSWFDSMLPSSQPESSDFAPMANSLDIEPYQSPDYNSLANNPINNDSAFALNPPLQSAGSSFETYDDLRRKNRIDYENRAIPNRPPQSSQAPQAPQQLPTDQRPPGFDSAFDSPPRSSDYWR